MNRTAYADNPNDRSAASPYRKLLNADGRYLAAADSYAQIIAPPPNPGKTPNGHSTGTGSKPSSWHRQER